MAVLCSKHKNMLNNGCVGCLGERIKELEQFKHQHRDCDKMGCELQHLRQVVKDVVEGDFTQQTMLTILEQVIEQGVSDGIPVSKVRKSSLLQSRS